MMKFDFIQKRFSSCQETTQSRFSVAINTSKSKHFSIQKVILLDVGLMVQKARKQGTVLLQSGNVTSWYRGARKAHLASDPSSCCARKVAFFRYLQMAEFNTTRVYIYYALASSSSHVVM